MFFRHLAAFAFLVITGAACGGPPPDPIERTESALVTNDHTVYGCNGDWHFRQTFATRYVAITGSYTVTVSAAASQTDVNEITLICPSFTMLSNGSVLYNVAPLACYMLSHVAGIPGYSWDANVTIPTYGIQHVLPSLPTFPNGYEVEDLHMPTSLNDWGNGYGLAACWGTGSHVQQTLGDTPAYFAW